MFNAGAADTIKVTGTITSFSPGAESLTVPAYAVDDAFRPEGFADMVSVPPLSDAVSQFPSDGVVTTGVALTARFAGLMATGRLWDAGVLPLTE
jgi:hypothetical protein